MNTNELRIGNLTHKSIKSGNGRTIVCNITINDLVKLSDETTHFKYEPIPLTDEWLLKLGFRKKSDHIFLFPNNDSFRLWGFAWNIEQFMMVGGWIELNTPSIKYVHQLQNLYLCLTGEELIIPV